MANPVFQPEQGTKVTEAGTVTKVKEKNQKINGRFSEILVHTIFTFSIQWRSWL